MLEIYPATIHDLPALRKMAIETQIDTFGEHNTPENMEAFLLDAYSEAQFKREFMEEGSIYYIALDKTEPAGFLRMRLNDEAEAYLGKNTIELQRLYVTKNYLGKKVGAALMRQALTYARAKEYAWIWLGVWERNVKAQEFYRKWGFTRFSEHTFWMGSDPQTDWLLKLNLTAGR